MVQVHYTLKCEQVDKALEFKKRKKISKKENTNPYANTYTIKSGNKKIKIKNPPVFSFVLPTSS